MPETRVGFTDFAVLRLPLKSATFAAVTGAPKPDADVTLENRLAFQVDEVLRLVDDPAAKAAISFASPGLIERVSSHGKSSDAKSRLRLAMSAYKYLSRMSSRPTPFGAFASMSHVRIGKPTNLESEAVVRLHARLDNGALQKLLDTAMPDTPEDLRGLRVRLSNTAYALGGEIRSFVGTRDGDKPRSTLSTFRLNEGLAFVMEVARDWMTAEDFVARLVESVEVEEGDGWAFLHQLIAKQLIVTELQISVSSGDTFRDILIRSSASANERSRERLAPLRQVSDRLDSITKPDEIARGLVADIVTALGAATGEDFDGGRTVHIDAYRDADFRIASEDLEAIRGDLADIAHLIWQRNESIEGFKNRFREKFADSRVPLLHALDPDGGVGFGPSRSARSPLLDGASPAGVATPSVKWDTWQQALLEAVFAGIANQLAEVELDSSQVRDARRFDPSASTAIYKHPVALLVLQRREVNGPITAILNGVSGPSALALIGRFAGGLPSLEASARTLAQSEQDFSKAILAELIHLPDPRTANVIVRKRLRQHELHCGLGGTAGYDDQNLPCSSLYLHLEGARLVLTTDDGTEILPRLSSAHNSNGYQLPAYQFLTALQHQEGISRHLCESVIFDGLPYVPRIRYRSLTLSPARWIVSAKEIADLTKSPLAADRLTAIRRLRWERGFPRNLTLVDGDNLLEVDLDCELATLTLIEEISGRRRVVLRESVGSMNALPIVVSGEEFRHELFLPLEITTEIPLSSQEPSPAMLPSILARRPLPLENWVYADLFCGEASGDTIISSIIAPFTQRHAGTLERWFFVRFYENGEHHLRVRLLTRKSEDKIAILEDFLCALRNSLDAPLIHRCRISPYESEVDRYGGAESLVLCEQLFTLNSVYVAEVISAINRSADKEQDRWLHGLRALWSTLEDAVPSLQARRNLARRMFESYRTEIPAPNKIPGAASANFRRDRKIVESIVFERELASSIDDRRDIRAALISKIRAALPEHRFIRAITSVIHMDCNRLFPYHARMNEMMLYEYANRTLTSAAARNIA